MDYEKNLEDNFLRFFQPFVPFLRYSIVNVLEKGYV